MAVLRRDRAITPSEVVGSLRYHDGEYATPLPGERLLGYYTLVDSEQGWRCGWKGAQA